MKAKILTPLVLLACGIFTCSYADNGAQLFRANCGACHSIGNGKVVGPDLKGVETRHTDAWILKWVKSSQTLVKTGDKDAVKLFKDNNQIVMPDQPLNDADIKSILAYIKAGGDQPVSASSDKVADKGTTVKAATVTAKVVNGQNGFDTLKLLGSFSLSEYLLMFLSAVLLLVVYILGGTVKNLTTRLKETGNNR